MILNLFTQGFVIGIAIAAPVGPISILCINRTLANGRKAGFITGLGAASADAVYGSIAAFGLSFMAAFLVNQSLWLRFLGGLFLLFIGVRTFFKNPGIYEGIDPGKTTRRSVLNYYLSTFILTITNPLTILSFSAIYAAVGIGGDTTTSYLASSGMVFGVFLGSSAWWLILSSLTNRFRTRIQFKMMTWINRISAAILILFGLYSLFTLTFYL